LALLSLLPSLDHLDLRLLGHVAFVLEGGHLVLRLYAGHLISVAMISTSLSNLRGKRARHITLIWS
jgi:hypothetical protein